MDALKKLFFITALILTASITSAASVDSSAWQFNSSTSSHPDISINEIYMADHFLFSTDVPSMTGNTPIFVDVNSSISQNIGQVNSGDVLNFNLTRQSAGWVLSNNYDYSNLYRAFRDIRGTVSISNNLGSQSQVFINLGDIYEPLYMHGLAIGNQFEGTYEFNQISIPLDSSLVGGTDTNLSISLYGDFNTFYFELPLSGYLSDVSDIWGIEINNPNPVPLPAGIYLFLSGIVGLGLMRGRNA